MVTSARCTDKNVAIKTFQCFLTNPNHYKLSYYIILCLILFNAYFSVSVCDKVVNFVCPVRSQCTQSVTVPSRINQCWTLKCVIEGKHWSGPPTLLVDPPQQNTYEITYKPLVMTADGQRHEVQLSQHLIWVFKIAF